MKRIKKHLEMMECAFVWMVKSMWLVGLFVFFLCVCVRWKVFKFYGPCCSRPKAVRHLMWQISRNFWRISWTVRRHAAKMWPLIRIEAVRCAADSGRQAKFTQFTFWEWERSLPSNFLFLASTAITKSQLFIASKFHFTYLHCVHHSSSDHCVLFAQWR